MLTYPIGLLAPKGGGLPTDGLIGEWLFNGNASDTSGSGYNGTVTGAALTTDRHSNSNSAYLFGGSDRITVSSPPENLIQFSFSIWIYPTATPASTRYFLDSREAFNDRLLFQMESSNTIDIGYSDTDFVETTVNYSVSLNTWYHIAYLYDNGSIDIYVNNSYQGTLTVGANTFDFSVTNLIFGNNTPLSLGFTGKIDDIRWYNRILNIAEIAILYNE